MLKILVIDDSRMALAVARSSLEPLGFQVNAITNPMLAAYVIGKFFPNVILCDYNLGGITGRNVIEALRNHDRDVCPIALMSSDAGEAMSAAAELGVRFYVKDDLFKRSDLRQEILSLAGRIP